MRTTDGSLLVVVKSMLEACGVPFIVRGESALGFLPLGKAAARVTKRSLGATILVPPDRAEEARLLISTPAGADPTDLGEG